MDNFGITAIQLGRACYEGRIEAYLPDVELPVYEFSKLPRIPKYPPAGIDPMDHVKSGETVKWNWEDILGVSTLRRELSRIEYALGVLIPVMKKKIIVPS